MDEASSVRQLPRWRCAFDADSVVAIGPEGMTLACGMIVQPLRAAQTIGAPPHVGDDSVTLPSGHAYCTRAQSFEVQGYMRVD